jgi:hypothetical protein
MSGLATLERPRALPVEAPQRWRAADYGIRIGRVVVKVNELHGGSAENRITLSGGAWGPMKQEQIECQEAPKLCTVCESAIAPAP